MQCGSLPTSISAVVIQSIIHFSNGLTMEPSRPFAIAITMNVWLMNSPSGNTKKMFDRTQANFL